MPGAPTGADSEPPTARDAGGRRSRDARYGRRLAAGSVAAAVVAIAALAFATDPVAARSANRALIDGLYVRLLAIAVPVTTLALAVLGYAVVRFRGAAEPTPTPERPILELSWTVATILLLVVAGLWTYPVLATPYLSPGAGADDGGGTTATEIEVVASQWQWRVAYEDANVTTRDELVVPADEEVRLVLTSRDVVHAFAVPELGVKRDVLPGEETTIRTRVHEPGTYRAQCTAFCGAGHAEMTATVTVVDRETYEAWLAAREGDDGATEPPDPSASVAAASADRR